MNSRILQIEGWMHEIELNWLNTMAQKVPENGLIVEIGAWMGRGSTAIYTGANGKRRVVSIDTWKGSPDEPEHEIVKVKDIFALYKLNTSFLGFYPSAYVPKTDLNGTYYIIGDSADSASMFEDCSIDWLFIDGWHTHFYRDLDAYLPKMKTNGLLSGHDYFCFYEHIQQEIHKRFFINQVVHSIWIRYMGGHFPPEWLL